MQRTLVNDTVGCEYEVELTDESVECSGFPLPCDADNVDRDARADNHKTHAGVCRCGIQRYHQQEDDAYHEGDRDEYVELQTTSVAAVRCVDTQPHLQFTRLPVPYWLTLVTKSLVTLWCNRNI